MKWYYWVVLFLFLTLFFVMAELPVWGMLQKSQDDPETIEDAIARLIDTHNDDPTSHIGTDQSLGAHRENEIIDHPAGSMVFDKLSETQLYHYDNFMSPASSYDPEGNVYSGQGSLALTQFHVSSGISDARVPIPSFQNATFPSKEIVAQFELMLDWNTSADIILLQFGNSDDGFGIKMTSNALKVFLTQNGIITYSSTISYTKGTQLTWRIHLVPDDSNIYFYIDGELVATIATGSSSAPDLSGGLYIEGNCTLTTYFTIVISALRLGYFRDLL